MSIPISASALLDAALSYAARSWHVIPLHTAHKDWCSCSKAGNCDSPGKHPRIKHWRNEASIDPAIIRKWWAAWPDANVGIVTGAPSGLVALDVDPRHDGDESLWQLIKAHADAHRPLETVM